MAASPSASGARVVGVGEAAGPGARHAHGIAQSPPRLPDDLRRLVGARSRQQQHHLVPGRGTRLKGHADAIALLANLRASGIDARLWMPGALQDGREAYLAELEDLVRVADVEDAVAITEATDDIAGAYAASDLVLQLSRKPESFGRTVIEALSVGRPALGWAHGGVGELLQVLQPAGAVAPFDITALASAARNLLAHPPAPVATMQAYRLDAMQEATLALYQSLVDA